MGDGSECSVCKQYHYNCYCRLEESEIDWLEEEYTNYNAPHYDEVVRRAMNRLKYLEKQFKITDKIIKSLRRELSGVPSHKEAEKYLDILEAE